MKEESLLSINTYSHCSVDLYAEQQQTYPLIKKKKLFWYNWTVLKLSRVDTRRKNKNNYFS